MASNPGQIPAGGRDKISVVVHTHGKGGQKVTKRFRVSTNDPKQEKVELVVTGQVEGLVDIEPPRVSLIGKVGEVLTQEVRITPKPKYPFTIKDIKARSDKVIQLDLKPAGKNPAKQGYVLKITLIKKEAGAFGEYIQLNTDLKEKPIIGISVHGRLLGPTPTPKDLGKRP